MKARTVGELQPAQMVAMPFALVQEITRAMARLNALTAHEHLMAITERKDGVSDRAEDALLRHRLLAEEIASYVERARVYHLGPVAPYSPAVADLVDKGPA